jgi:hypothetical protein
MKVLIKKDALKIVGPIADDVLNVIGIQNYYEDISFAKAEEIKKLLLPYIPKKRYAMDDFSLLYREIHDALCFRASRTGEIIFEDC